jgi:predicted phosphoribosyltransferase
LVFADRDDAGRRLAARLGHLRGEPVVVLGLPRGGVPVAFQVAQALGAPLDVIVVRKLGVPFQPELGMGAVGEDGVRVINPKVVHASGVSEDEVAAVQAREQAAVEARAARYRVRRPRQPLDGRVAVVVDDGIATGSTARAACQIARAQGAARVVLAVPVAPPGWQARITSPGARPATAAGVPAVTSTTPAPVLAGPAAGRRTTRRRRRARRWRRCGPSPKPCPLRSGRRRRQPGWPDRERLGRS